MAMGHAPTSRVEGDAVQTRCARTIVVAVCAVAGAAACLASGCATIPVASSSAVAVRPLPSVDSPTANDKRSKIWQADRLDHGYVVVLPGSWGETAADHGIVDGLVTAGIDAAIEIYAWPVGDYPTGFLMVPYNLRATTRNRGQAREVAAKIIRYQKDHPGRPVHLIGYSGGGGIATWTLEELPDDARIASAILLAPTLSYSYDLRKALAHTDRGIDSFYSLYDVTVMMAGCSIVGTTDGSHLPAGGAVGFRQPRVSGEGNPVVRQHAYTLSMITGGHSGGHYGWTRQGFVTAHVAPLLAGSVSPLIR
jgi:hypothetical protein